MSRGAWLVLVMAAAMLAALAGVAAGRYWLAQPEPAHAPLHALLHEGLDLDRSQEARVEMLERAFAQRRAMLEDQMRADNARLAAAIRAEGRLGPSVSAAIDRCHLTMGALQKATLEHVFAMRALLRPDQARRFDGAVTDALTADGR